jgi:hypothetical protein
MCAQNAERKDMAIDLVDSGYFDLTIFICILPEDPPPPLPAGLIQAWPTRTRTVNVA